MNKSHARAFWEVTIGTILVFAVGFLGFSALGLQGELTEARQDAAQTAEKLAQVQSDLGEAENAAEERTEALEACSAQNDAANEVADVFYDVLAYLAGASYSPPSERAINEAFKDYETLEACK